MANAHFRPSIRFAKGAAKRLVIKKRIVAKAVGSARLVNYAAFYHASKYLRILIFVHQRDHADEPGCPIFYSLQLLEQPAVIEVGGVDAGAPAQCVYLNS